MDHVLRSLEQKQRSKKKKKERKRRARRDARPQAPAPSAPAVSPPHSAAEGEEQSDGIADLRRPLLQAQCGGMLFERTGTGIDSTSLEQLALPSPDDMAVCIKVLEQVAENPKLLRLPELRPLRVAIHPVVDEQIRKYGLEVPGTKRARDRDRGVGRRKAKRQRLEEEEDDVSKAKEMEKEYINSTMLRAARVKRLEALMEEGKDEVARIPDGVALLPGGETRLFLTNGQEKSTLVGIEDGSDDESAPSAAVDEESMEDAKILRTPLSCYICKKPFRELHFFYDRLCPECAAFNYKKRNELADMDGRVCLVTGGRVKIGFQCVLKLLRCGATVIATTRFPVDAARRYAAEADYSAWKHRLHVYGLDFRHVRALELFCLHLRQTYDRLDVIVNNACQTIRRPAKFYSHLLEAEQSIEGELPPALEPLLASHRKASEQLRILAGGAMRSGEQSEGESADSEENGRSEHRDRVGMVSGAVDEKALGALQSAAGGASSAMMTQLHVVEEDKTATEEHFPVAVLDVNEQQVDLRGRNSWMLRLHEVETSEVAEVLVINALAPTVLNAKLKPLMERDMDEWKFVVNVSAMEGKFYRYKSEHHPHTNMAKAALNMMTRTSAADYRKSNIFMTAVDTGWINDEKPISRAVQHMQKHNFQTPLDEIDAASRVLDPVIAPLALRSSGVACEPPWGHFLKDFIKCEW